MKEIIGSIDDSQRFLNPSLQSLAKDKRTSLPFEGHEFVHLGETLADEDKVVTGFQFYHHGNRLAIRIKQGMPKELGNIGEENWKETEQAISATDVDGLD